MTGTGPAGGGIATPQLMSRQELRRRASAGVVLVGSRGVAIMLLGFAGQVVLARLLTPADFGAVAVGMAFVMFVNLFSDGGLGAGLIRRPEPPDRRELQALSALQVSVAAGLALAVAAAAPLFGRTGWVTAVVVAAAPLLALQIPGRIVLERAVSLSAVGGGLVLTGLAGAAPGLVPGLLGEQWRSAAVLLPPACLGLAVGGAVSVACEGYLYAVGDAAAVLRSGLLQAAVLFGVALPLLSVLGVRAVGLAWLAAYLVEAVTLGRAVHRHSGARVGRSLAVAVAAALVGGTAGLLVTAALGADLVAGLVGGATACAAFTLVLLVVRRPLLLECLRFGLSAVRAASRPGAEAAEHG